MQRTVIKRIGIAAILMTVSLNSCSQKIDFTQSHPTENVFEIESHEWRAIIEKTASETVSADKILEKFKELGNKTIPVIYDINFFGVSPLNLYSFFKRPEVPLKEKQKLIRENIILTLPSAKIFIIDLLHHLLNSMDDRDHYRIQTSLYSLGKKDLEAFISEGHKRKPAYFKREVQEILSLVHFTIDTSINHWSKRQSRFFIGDGNIINHSLINKELNYFNREIRELVQDLKVDDFLFSYLNESKNFLKVLQIMNQRGIIPQILSEENGEYLARDELITSCETIASENIQKEEKELMLELLTDLKKSAAKIMIDQEIRLALSTFENISRKKKHQPEKTKPHNLQAITPVYLMGNHSQAYIAWRMAQWHFNIRDNNCKLIHVDTHADLSVKRYIQLEETVNSIEKNKGNYQKIKDIADKEFKISGFISPAIYKKIFDHIYWVIPAYTKPGSDNFHSFFNSEKKQDLHSPQENFTVYLLQWQTTFFSQKILPFSQDADPELKKNQKIFKARYDKIHAENLPIFASQDCIYLDIDLDFFNNSGWDTDSGVKGRQNLEQLKNMAESLFQNLRAANIRPVVVTIADSPIYTKGSEIVFTRNLALTLLTEYLPANYKKIQIQEAYHPQILYALVTLRQHFGELRKNRQKRILKLKTKNFPDQIYNEGNFKTIEEVHSAPWVYLAPDFYMRESSFLQDSHNFYYFFSLLKKIPTTFYLNTKPFPLLEQLQNLQRSLTSNNLEGAKAQINQIDDQVEKLIFINRYAIDI